MYLCAEFIDIGTETTGTSLVWIMANLVRNPNLQEKLAEELGNNKVGKPYLKAVVLEGLRCHPPGQSLIHHAAIEDTSVGGYTIPKGMNVDYGVTSVNWNAEIEEKREEEKKKRRIQRLKGEATRSCNIPNSYNRLVVKDDLSTMCLFFNTSPQVKRR